MVRADYDPAKDPIKDALLEGLQALGYVEGKNIHIEYRVPVLGGLHHHYSRI
jgi:hypothetical protein